MRLLEPAGYLARFRRDVDVGDLLVSGSGTRRIVIGWGDAGLHTYMFKQGREYIQIVPWPGLDLKRIRATGRLETRYRAGISAEGDDAGRFARLGLQRGDTLMSEAGQRIFIDQPTADSCRFLVLADGESFVEHLDLAAFDGGDVTEIRRLSAGFVRDQTLRFAALREIGAGETLLAGFQDGGPTAFIAAGETLSSRQALVVVDPRDDAALRDFITRAAALCADPSPLESLRALTALVVAAVPETHADLAAPEAVPSLRLGDAIIRRRGTVWQRALLVKAAADGMGIAVSLRRAARTAQSGPPALNTEWNLARLANGNWLVDTIDGHLLRASEYVERAGGWHRERRTRGRERAEAMAAG